MHSTYQLRLQDPVSVYVMVSRPREKCKKVPASLSCTGLAHFSWRLLVNVNKKKKKDFGERDAKRPLSPQSNVTTKKSWRGQECLGGRGGQRRREIGGRFSPASGERSLPSPTPQASPRICWCLRCSLCAEDGQQTHHTLTLCLIRDRPVIVFLIEWI